MAQRIKASKGPDYFVHQISPGKAAITRDGYTIPFLAKSDLANVFSHLYEILKDQP